jgi:predicted ArsR family transcriptional regulator
MEPRGAADLADLSLLSGFGSPVRRRLYEFVARAGRAVGREEAAESAGISRSLAAYHLDKLTAVGLLEAGFTSRHEGRGRGAGRPAKLYRRSRKEFVLRAPPRDYELLGELLVRAADEDASGIVRATLEQVAYDVGYSLGQEASRGEETAREGLMAALRQRGFEPFEDEDGTIRLRNCPFEQVATQCPDVVCNVNLRLVCGVVEGLGLRDAQAALEPEEGRCCVAIAAARE